MVLNCNLCQGSELKLVQKGNIDINKHLERFSQYKYYGDLYKCKSCDLIMQKFEHEVDDIINRLMDEEYLDEEIGHLNITEKHVQFNKLINILKKYDSLKGKAILDAGANTGIFLDMLKAYSSDLEGLEASSEAAKHAREIYNLNVQNAVIGKGNIEDASKDIITLWDVIEHLYDPKHDLEFLHSKLKMGGRIFISTHNIGGMLPKMMGAKYPFYMYQHFYHFSKKTLGKMMKEVGFKVLGTESFCKTWTVGYLKELSKKQNYFGFVPKPFSRGVNGVLNSSRGNNMHVTIPVPHFFTIVGEK